MFVAIWQFLVRFALDPTFAKSRARALLAVIAGSGYTFADDLAAAIGDPTWARRIKIGSILLGVIAAAVKAGEQNDDAHAMAEKLRAAGYRVEGGPETVLKAPAQESAASTAPGGTP